MVAFVDSKGQRSSSATAYLMDEVTARKNLTIAVSPMVNPFRLRKMSW
jgi:choline dehydrogenase